jgi:hypothetical protein
MSAQSCQLLGVVEPRADAADRVFARRNPIREESAQELIAIDDASLRRASVVALDRCTA